MFPAGFPPRVVASLERDLGRRLIGNKAASGTLILDELGEEHLRTGALILYTSADSVLQLAAHRDVLPAEALHDCCRRARAVLDGLGCRVLRVIARPFEGAPGAFVRSHGRRDFSLPPPGRTLPERLHERGGAVLGIGKVGDIFLRRGLAEVWETAGNRDGIAKIARALRQWRGPLVLANLLDFDTLYGHRNDPGGFAEALEEFDRALGEQLLPGLGAGDLLVITADHGCDPLTGGWDHTREYVPLLACLPGLRGPVTLGTRASHLDLAATLSEALCGEPWPEGESFWPLLRAARAG